MKRIFIALMAFFTVLQATAQKQVYLTIKHMLGSDPFNYGATKTNDLGQNFNISRIDYYISGISIIHDGGAVTPVPDFYLLVKGKYNVSELLGSYSMTNIEGIKFHIGVDSPNNNADPSLWPTLHPLAPKTPSMHWGWAAGYRFVAIEGEAGPSLKTGYQMHGLWNANYFEQTIMTTGVSRGSEIWINLDADYVEAVRGIDVASGPIDHGVNVTDLKLLQNFRDYVFSEGTGLPTSIKTNVLATEWAIFPNPSKGSATIFLSQAKSGMVYKALVFDMMGRKVKEQVLPNTNEAVLRIDQKGIFMVQLYEGTHQVAQTKLLVE